jgi:ankyrin repeat protein
MKYENWVFGKDGALLSACAHGKANLVESLLAEGASPNVTSPNGFTALHRAAENGHLQIVQLLLKNGAKADTLAADGSSPVSAARQAGHTSTAEEIAKYV